MRGRPSNLIGKRLVWVGPFENPCHKYWRGKPCKSWHTNQILIDAGPKGVQFEELEGKVRMNTIYYFLRKGRIRLVEGYNIKDEGRAIKQAWLEFAQ